jgi:hypothetical protein
VVIIGQPQSNGVRLRQRSMYNLFTESQLFSFVYMIAFLPGFERKDKGIYKI